MRPMKSIFCAAAVAAVVVCGAMGPWGCGNSLQSAFVPAARFPAAYAQALCTSLQHCCNENLVHFDYNACTSGWKNAIQARFDDPNSSANANYDPKAATSCVQLVQGAQGVTCAPEPASISDARDTCQQIFAGKKPPGSACVTTAECAPVDGAIVTCSPLPPGADGGGQLPLSVPMSEPVCVAVPLPTDGAPCTVTPAHGCEGDPTLFCDPIVLTCKARSDVAGPCNAATPESCLPTAFCIASGPNAGICAAVLPQGSACDNSGQCDPTSSCDTGGTKTCVPRKQPGSQCTANSDCATGACDSVQKICLKNVIATTNACTGVAQ